MGEMIRVENLSKKFIIGHEQSERYTALRDVVARKAKKIFSFSAAARNKNKNYSTEEFWALKDINFTVSQGDRVGIIGRNGAGKSTLLKVLSRITEPSGGRITIKGRVASLLEVGTGFHPELTGRENIFLNGAILGMGRAEIKSKFDEIVAFAEVEKFLDTPVKRYSSGMYVRLAFAVAAHLEPEILIVDEVLAVGDAQFQKKCLGKMEEVSRNDGRTILFVSHNLAVLKTLCNTGILLSEGKLVQAGDVSDIVSKYLDATNTPVSKKYSHKEGGKIIRISNVDICGEKNPIVRCLSWIDIDIEFESTQGELKSEFFVLLYNLEGICVQSAFQADDDSLSSVELGAGKVTVRLHANLFPGKYYVSVGAFDRYKNFLDWVEHCESFEIEPVYEDGRVFTSRLGMSISTAVWNKKS